MSQAMTRDDAEELSQSLAQVGEGWYRLVGWAFRQGVHETLGMSRRDWRIHYYGHLKIGDIEERREAEAELVDEGMNNSEIADTLGVDEATVRRDLKESDSANAEPHLGDLPDVQVEEPTLEPDSANAEPEPSETESESAEESESEPEPAPLEPAAPGWHRLGDHLLYCGDSTDQEFIDACHGAFAFADPPYNTGKAEWDAGFEWKHDYLAEVAEVVAVTPGIAALAGFHTITGMAYQWSIAAEVTNGMTRGALGFGNWIYVALFSNGSIYRNSKDCIRIPAHTSDDEGGSHAARKPLQLLTKLIGLFTTKGDTVVDPFLGSGTTLIAADREGRRCIGAEIDPMHCAEIIQRYRKAVHQ